MEIRGIEMLVALVAIVSLLAAGCSKRSTLPETYPVRGKVVFQGGPRVCGGSVQFRGPQVPIRTMAQQRRSRWVWCRVLLHGSAIGMAIEEWCGGTRCRRRRP